MMLNPYYDESADYLSEFRWNRGYIRPKYIKLYLGLLYLQNKRKVR